MSSNGKVYLVGAGPGDAGLLTLKGANVLKQADVVVYDRLMNPDLLRLAPRHAEFIYVGKESGRHTLSQEAINALLVAKAREGKTVVRLKGGDPFVFGRGAEEAEFLRAHNCAFEIVPGVSSAYAVPAYAGIPVTDRRYAMSFAAITGHGSEEHSLDVLAWQSFAQGIDTLVFFMSLGNISEVVSKLIANGRDAKEPAALIEKGTTSKQRVVQGTLDELPKLAQAHGIQSPALIVIGKVVNLRKNTAWYEALPLAGKTVVITRTPQGNERLRSLLEAQGAQVFELPLIRTESLPLPPIKPADWYIFTSPNGVEHFFEGIKNSQQDVRNIGTAKIAAVGAQTAEALSKYGLKTDFIPQTSCFEALMETLPLTSTTQRIVIVAPEGKQPPQKSLLERSQNINAELLYAYRTVKLPFPPWWQNEFFEDIDLLLFASSSAVEAFCQNITNIPQHIQIACFGPQTAKTAYQYGLNVSFVGDAQDMLQFVQKITTIIKNKY